ncbi:IS110 family transposase [Nocardioides massiliensis]|uniref:Transposase n=1 Tax=Nocardioides massiliensis TaxID=1325935 RepID=A0ABT9NP66_9ACTN|nr:IS110 family transposase [Nocardioides massiliensis]MDP9820233.1 transposase [Nocardioides massiliensis]MDP9820960.1 transposase [Nocardioides massiliensis]MDP9822221.1 transposase [Nocardioides massiliensis]MDP9822637.1 transposase [Nocardioides massiliensis]MDP9822897.1 transposase [Nocardioides massiliensis]
MSVTPEATRPRVCAGLDWAKDDHVVCILDPDGEVLDRFTVEHTAAGLKRLVRRLLAAEVVEIGIERGDGPVIDALLATELTVLVISPNQVKNLRSRYGSAGNKDDRFDAYVLADVVRTDRRRLTPLTRSTPATQALRSSVRARRDLVAHRVAAANQLRAHLQVVFPGIVDLFAHLDSAISLSFLERFPTQTKADWLTADRLAAWLKKLAYSGRTDPAVLHQRLLAAPRGTTGAETGPHAATTLAFVAVLRSLNTQIATLADSIAEQLDVHPDAHVVTSLPRSGTVRAARLLAEIGDARGRFPTADSLACLAGVAPSTRQSGKVKAVTFRWGCDKELRDALCDFAADSRHANPWAADLYNRARARNHDHPHAVRILARAWVDIIWRCWQDRATYDPSQHRAFQRVLNEHHQIAA